MQGLSNFEEGSFAGVVVVEGDFDGLDLVGDEGLEKFVGKAVGAVGCGDCFHAVAVEGERVDEGFAEDDFSLLEGFGVEDAVMGSG